MVQFVKTREINWFWVLSWSICVMLCVVFLHVAGFGIKTKKIWFVMDWRICTFCCIIWCFTGPYNYVRHLLSRDRILLTGYSFSSVFLTIYSACILKSSILTIFTSIIEILAVLYYTLSYFPLEQQL